MEETNREVRLDWVYSLDGKRSTVELPILGEVGMFVDRYTTGESTSYFDSDTVDCVVYDSGLGVKYYKGVSERETLIQEQIRLEDHLREWLPKVIEEAQECLEKLNG